MAAKYLTMVGQLQWLVTLGRFDIHAQVATMSRFRAAPRQRHMDRLKRIYSYAIRTKDYAIRFRTEQPDYSFLPDQDFDWTYSVYGDVHEILPDDMPEPLGEAVTTTTTYNLSDMLSKHWDHPTVYPMILKLLITRDNITLIPRESTQEKEKDILNPQPEKEKKNEKENKNMK